MLLSIVIPAYNEASRLPSTLDRLLSFLNQPGAPEFEIVIVDDGSTDETVSLATSYTEKHANFRVIKNPGNRGKGYAVRHGMLEARGDWILFTDADLSTPIEELTKLRQAADNQHAAIAFGSRAVNPSLVEIHQPLSRELAGRTFNLLLRVLVGLPFLDTQCGFKLFRRDAARGIFELQKLDGFSFDVESLVIAKELSFKAVEVPVVWRNAEGSKVTLLQGLRSFTDLIKIKLYSMQGHYRSV